MQKDTSTEQLGGIDFRDTPGAATPRPDAGPAAMAAEFEVNFGQTIRSTQVAADSTGFVGPARLRIEGEQLLISGTRRKAWGLDASQQLRYPLRSIVNVRRGDSGVIFEIAVPAGQKRQKVRFGTRNAMQAHAIQRALPTRVTADFAKEQAHIADFAARMSRMKLRAPLTPCLIAINIIVFIAMASTGAGIDKVDSTAAMHWGSNYGPLTTDGQWWRLVTAMFVHFGLLHVGMNMYALYMSGRVVEKLYGSTRFILLYLFAGIVGGMTSLLWNPQVNSAGASGAIFGVFGGLLAFMVNKRNDVPASSLSQVGMSLLLFGGYSLFNGFVHQGIDNAAHLGGLVGGFAMGMALARPLNESVRAKIGLPQIIAAILGGVVIVAALAWPLAHPSAQTLATRHFRQLLGEFHAKEVVAVDTGNRIGKQANAHEITARGYADALEQQAIPQWQALYDQFAAISLSPNEKDYPVQQQLLRYLRDRRDQLRDSVRAVRENNASLASEAKAKRADADDAIAELKKLSGQ